MVTADDFLKALEPALLKFVEQSWANYRDQALSDGRDFVNQFQDDLKNWAGQFKSGQINEVEFRFNLNSKKALARLTALKEKGLAEVALDKFTNGLFDLVIQTAKTTFFP